MATRDLDELDIPFMSINDPAYLVDPHGSWRQFRQDHWLVRTEMGVNVLPYAVNVDVVHRRELSGRFGDGLLRMQGITDGLVFDYWHKGLLMAMEHEQHDRIRKILVTAFTRTAAERLRPVMREIGTRLIDEFEAGDVEFVTAFADRYPIEVFARMMGIPDADVPQFRHWSTDLGRIFTIPIHPVLPTVEEAIRGLYAYSEELIARRRGQPGDDLLSQLLLAEEDGDRLSGEELQWQVLNMIFSGHDTTRNELGNILAMFCEHPEQWKVIRSEPELVGNAVEEGLRLNPTIPQTTRTVETGDLEVGGVRFPVGTSLVLRSDTANRDPEVFDDPDAFDVRRGNASRHISFGGSRTRCLGANLARVELQEAISLLSQRFTDVGFVGDVVWRPYSAGIQGPDEMPLSFASVGA